MKNRLAIAALVTGVIGGSAHAAFTDTQSGGANSKWREVSTTVTTTVKRWLGWGEASNQSQPVVKAPAPAVRPKGQDADQVTPSELVGGRPKASLPATAAGRAPAEKLVRPEGSSLSDVRAARDRVKTLPLMKVVEPGRPAEKTLSRSTVGVPLANWATVRKTKKIAKLDIGTEDLVSAEDFQVSNLAWGAFQPQAADRLATAAPLDSKEVASFEKLQVAKALGARGLSAKIRSVELPLTAEDVAKVVYTLTPAVTFKELPYKPLNPDQLKMLAALILFNRGDHCHMIMGLFSELASREANKREATFHLGACAAQLQMHQSAFENLTALIKLDDKDFALPALKLLAKDLPKIYEKDLYQISKSLKTFKNILASLEDEKAIDAVRFRLAKGAYRSGDFKASGALAEQISDKSEFYDEAVFLSGMNSYATGDKPGALKKLEGLWVRVEPRKTASTSNIRALTSVNLARMYFSQKKFDKALEHYMQVPKDHPLWVQGLIEQGWTQLALEDFSGAIGNMYSLHSPYFKAVYQPESFVVRTIGYLNICQYGDAYRTLNFIEKDYRNWQTKFSTYLEQKRSPAELYSTVRTYIKGKSTSDVEGVPFQVWREMAHRRDFLNLQTALNEKADETRRYNGVNAKIKTEKASIRWRADQAKRRFDEVRSLIAKAKTDKKLQKNVDQWKASLNLEKDLIIGYRFQLSLLEQSRQGYLEFQKYAQAALDRESGTLANSAGSVLLTHAKKMQTDMSRVLENNEFLRYEVFAGSGENIRYQVAGGEVAGPNRIPANILPTRMLNWSFDGEFWEDEIGSYRSSLQNNCPVSGTANSPAEQAARASSDDQ